MKQLAPLSEVSFLKVALPEIHWNESFCEVTDCSLLPPTPGPLLNMGQCFCDIASLKTLVLS